jgi:hypothetical protein
MKKIKIKNNTICTNNYKNNPNTFSANLIPLNKFSEYFTKFDCKINIQLNDLQINENIKDELEDISQKINKLNYLLKSYNSFISSPFSYCPITMDYVPRVLTGLLSCGHQIYLPHIFEEKSKLIFDRCAICKSRIDTIFTEIDILDKSIYSLLKTRLPEIISNLFDILISKNIDSGIILLEEGSIYYKILKLLTINYKFKCIRFDEKCLDKISELTDSYKNIFFLNLLCENVATIFNNINKFDKLDKYFLLDENEMLRNGEILNMNNFFLQKYI